MAASAANANAAPTGKIIVVKLGLASTMPMLQNALTPEALDKLPGGSGKLPQPNTKEMGYKDRADLVRYHGPNGEFGIPAECLFAALVYAGRFVKFEAKRMISNAEMSMVPGFLKIREEFLAFKDQSPESWVVDKRRAVNPATDGAMCVVRPRFPKWELDATIEISLVDNVKLEQVRELMLKAGTIAGLCDHRKKGSFGRFKVSKWDAAEQLPELAAAA